MQHAHVLGAIHVLTLVLLGWHSAGRLTPSALHRLAAVYLLTWCNLVVTGLALSVVSKLNHVGLYFSVSLALAAALDTVLRLRHVAPAVVIAPACVNGDNDFVDRTVRRAAIATLLLAALASAVICIAHVPNNWDSVTYRFSRAFFYLSRGDLLHTGNPGDPRLTFYPLNGALSYVLLAIYHYPAKWFSAITYIAWAFTGLGVYLAARSLAASRTGGWVAAWL